MGAQKRTWPGKLLTTIQPLVTVTVTDTVYKSSELQVWKILIKHDHVNCFLCHLALACQSHYSFQPTFPALQNSFSVTCHFGGKY